MSRRIYFPALLANLAAVILLLGGAELLFRRQINRTAVFEEEPLYRYDDKLGWAPEPGVYSRDYGTVTILPEGFRGCPSNPLPAGRTGILAAGDSFTFGFFVSDRETWPDQLAGLTGWYIVNAGVSGYGLDQMALRLEEAVSQVKPDLVILSLIVDSVSRCELSKRRHNKPYYELVADRPVLRNSPVPPPAAGGSRPWYGRSALLNRFLDLLGREPEAGYIRVHNRGLEIAEYLLRRLGDLIRENGARLLVVIQPQGPDLEAGRDLGRDLERYLRSQDIPVLNLYPLMERDFPEVPVRVALFSAYTRHLSGIGYRWVAEEIADFIVRRHLLPEPESVRYRSGFRLAEFLKTIPDDTPPRDGETELAPAYFLRAVVRDNQGRYDLALADLSRGLELDPGNPVAYNHLGIIYGRQGRFGPAKAAFLKAIALKTEYQAPHNNLGIIYTSEGKIAAAIGSFQKAIARNYRYPAAQRNLAIAYVTIGDLPAAAGHYRQAIELEPNFLPAYRELGEIYSRMGRADEAEEMLRRAEELSPAPESLPPSPPE